MPKSHPSVDDMSNVSGPRERLAMRRRGQQSLEQPAPALRHLDPTQSAEAFEREMSEAIRPRPLSDPPPVPFFCLDESNFDDSSRVEDVFSPFYVQEDREVQEAIEASVGTTFVPTPPPLPSYYPKRMFSPQQKVEEGAAAVEDQPLVMNNQ